jgi:hypothetical protein
VSSEARACVCVRARSLSDLVVREKASEGALKECDVELADLHRTVRGPCLPVLIEHRATDQCIDKCRLARCCATASPFTLVAVVLGCAGGDADRAASDCQD